MIFDADLPILMGKRTVESALHSMALCLIEFSRCSSNALTMFIHRQRDLKEKKSKKLVNIHFSFDYTWIQSFAPHLN